MTGVATSRMPAPGGALVDDRRTHEFGNRSPHSREASLALPSAVLTALSFLQLILSSDWNSPEGLPANSIIGAIGYRADGIELQRC